MYMYTLLKCLQRISALCGLESGRVCQIVAHKNIDIYTCMHMYTYIQVHINIHIYIYIHIYVYTY